MIFEGVLHIVNIEINVILSRVLCYRFLELSLNERNIGASQRNVV